MKIHVNFDGLWSATRRITESRERMELNLVSAWKAPKYDVVVDDLRTGKEVTLKEIDVTSKLLTFKGRHVLLYIADQGTKFDGIMQGQNEACRFHVANCETLATMKKLGRYRRYVATTDLSGLPVSRTKRNTRDYTGLRLCDRLFLS